MIEVTGGQLPFSDVRGFRLQDFDTTCPVVPERQCPEKIALVSAYTANVTKGKDGLSPDAMQDRDICNLKLGEYRLWARELDCQDASNTECPTRGRMNESTVRQTGAMVVRKVMSVFGIRGH